MWRTIPWEYGPKRGTVPPYSSILALWIFPPKEWILSASNANDMDSCLLSFFLSNPNKKRIARGVKWVYDHLGRIWMSFRCRSDVVSDVVQIASGFPKFTIILLCDRSTPSETSGHTNNKPDVQIYPGKVQFQVSLRKSLWRKLLTLVQ